MQQQVSDSKFIESEVIRYFKEQGYQVSSLGWCTEGTNLYVNSIHEDVFVGSLSNVLKRIREDISLLSNIRIEKEGGKIVFTVMLSTSDLQGV